jgi:hydroxyacylglutathione hydrolase
MAGDENGECSVRAIPCLADNLCYAIQGEAEPHCLLVDPGEAAPVLAFLQENELQPIAVLLTHHHQDHVAGLPGLLARWPQLAVYAADPTWIACKSRRAVPGATLEFGRLRATPWPTPGHTADSLCWSIGHWLFTGDTLFVAGCGRLLGGTVEQLFHSLCGLLEHVPETTRLACGHDYGARNLAFALNLWPEDPACLQRLSLLQRTPKLQRSFSTLALERESNPFLRSGDPSYRALLEPVLGWAGSSSSAEEFFAILRKLRNDF